MPSDGAALYQPFPMLRGRRAQCWRHQPAYRRPRHFHAEPELNLVVRGQATLGVGERRVRLSAGELVVFAPGQDHELLEASEGLDLRVVGLRPELALHLAGANLQSGAFQVPAPLLAELVPELGQLDRVADGATVERRLLDAFGALVSIARSAPVRVRRSAELFRHEPALSCAEVARRLRAHPSELSRSFQGHYGVSPVSYRARLRLMQFVTLVDAGHSLTAAAIAASFGSYAQCARVFRATVGCSPQAYFAGERHRIDVRCEPARH
jgi:AraC-like DNA-binding protein